MKITDTPDNAEVEFLSKFYNLSENIVLKAFKDSGNNSEILMNILSKEQHKKSYEGGKNGNVS